MNSLNTLGYPRLLIVKQNCLAEEAITNKNGETTVVCVVVKHSPFVVKLALSEPSIDISCLTFEVKLCYDSADEKEVDFINSKPLEYKVKTDENKTFVNIECRLKVLTSQLEDMFFRLRFIALDPISKRELGPNFVVSSAPVKVISKPEQLRKIAPSLKRKANEVIYDSLEKLDMQQKGQSALLERLEQQIIFLISQPSIITTNHFSSSTSTSSDNFSSSSSSTNERFDEKKRT